AEVVVLGDLAELEKGLADGARAPEVVLAAIDAPEATAAANEALVLVRRWLASEWLGGSRLVVTTRGAVAVDGESPDIAQAAVW
ncbi:hypothetical protein, partial [Streptomyces sp. TRM49041]|uniref:hypothetical protein n=1 Tax=Streptomyces sp. TRM49041 TaxID=2603216 RepID=UPI0016568B61